MNLKKEFKKNMTNLDHENVVRLYGKYENNIGEIFIITEYINNGDLLKLLQNSPKKLPRSDQLTFMLHIALGLQYLHQRNVIHRDLAARNILMKKRRKWSTRGKNYRFWSCKERFGELLLYKY